MAVGSMNNQLKEVSLQLPASADAIAALEVGSIVYLSGVVYTAREGVYDRVLKDGATVPDELMGASNANFHCSPAAAPDGSGGYNGVTGVREVLWLDELGLAQAMWFFNVDKFGPFIVDSDLQGNSLFSQQGDIVNQNIEKLYEGLKRPALHRYGETDDRKDELL